jgi:MFS family permease
MLSVYLFGQQLGSILGLITGGAIADGPGWRWSQYIVAIIDAGVLVLLIFTFEETAFPRFLFTRLEGVVPARDIEATPSEIDDDKSAKLKVTPTAGTTHTDAASLHGPDIPPRTYLQKLKPWTYFPEDHTPFWDYVKRPFMLFTVPNIVIAGFIFAFGCTAGIVSFNTISSILSEPPYNFSTTSTGLVFFAALVGSIIGWATGVLSDFIVLFLARRNRGVREPEMRLWTLCFSFVYAAVGYMMYGWGAEAGASWVVIAFGLGCMIAHQVSACTIATAYAMECFPGISGELVVVLAICSSCINFALSYSIQPFIEATGFGYAFLFYGLCVLGSMTAAVPTCIWGKQWRKNAAPKWARWLAEREGR